MYAKGLINRIRINLFNGIKLIRSKKNIEIKQKTKPSKIIEIVVKISEKFVIFFIDKNFIKKK